MECDAEIALLWSGQAHGVLVSDWVVPRVVLLHVVHLELGEAVDELV